MGNQPLEYRKPERSQLRAVLLILSILLAVAVGGLSVLASAFMWDSTQWPLAAILIGGIVLLIGAAIAAAKWWGMSPVLAIFLASVCTFFLMIGMCSQFQLRLK